MNEDNNLYDNTGSDITDSNDIRFKSFDELYYNKENNSELKSDINIENESIDDVDNISCENTDSYTDFETEISKEDLNNTESIPYDSDLIADNINTSEEILPEKKKSKVLKKIIVAIIIICMSGCVGFGGGLLAIKKFGGGSVTQTFKIDGDTNSLNAASAIAAKTMPSVVGISTLSKSYYQTMFGLQQGTSEGVGTGIIVDEDGYILTNAHVIESNGTTASKITVDLYNGDTYDGTVLWSGSDQNLDLAIVKIDAKGLTAIELGDSDKVKIGDYALAIGNPLGLELERSVSQGIISGLDRTITATDGNSSSRMEGLIQTDASINAGNSGGPLINSKGQVIGINTASAKSAEGLGFSIPINTAMPIIEEIKENGTYEQSYIGILGVDLGSIIARYQTDFKASEGVYIQQIYTGSPAASAGIKEGDIITALDGTKIKDMNSLKAALVKHRPGDKVKLTIERNKEEIIKEVTLISAEESNTPVLQEQQESLQSNGSEQNSNDGSFGESTDPFSSIFGN